jgi:hypothetical protein
MFTRVRSICSVDRRLDAATPIDEPIAGLICRNIRLIIFGFFDPQITPGDPFHLAASSHQGESFIAVSSLLVG